MARILHDFYQWKQAARIFKMMSQRAYHVSQALVWTLALAGILIIATITS
jgi:hypothetical protein